ncbi:hypothetical protein KBI5_23310 [Frankia sp. KB5]|nr:hypothetical protein KBI5_23310 [Frankia sp. KB5]
MQHDDEAEISRLHDAITVRAEAEGLALAEIYVDRNMPPGRLIRPGLTVLLERLRQHEGSWLVVPTLDHLSSWPVVRRAIEMEVQLLSARVLALKGNGIRAAPALTESRADPPTFST